MLFPPSCGELRILAAGISALSSSILMVRTLAPTMWTSEKAQGNPYADAQGWGLDSYIATTAESEKSQ